MFTAEVIDKEGTGASFSFAFFEYFGYWVIVHYF